GVPRLMMSSAVIGSVAVSSYTSTRSSFAGRLPSLLEFGTVKRRSTRAPRRAATSSAGGAGTLTSGGSGGPAFPHAALAARASHTVHRTERESGPPAAEAGTNRARRLTECTATGPHS